MQRTSFKKRDRLKKESQSDIDDISIFLKQYFR